MKRWVWTILGIAVIAGAAAVGCRREQAAPAAAPQPAGPERIVAAGRVETAGEETLAGFELDGKLATVTAEEGDRVRRGEVLATLDNGDFAARAASARAAVAEQEAALERLRNGARPEQVREAAALLAEAESRRELAREELERRRPLVERGAVSRSEFAQTERDLETAAARVAAARERLALVERETRAEDLRRAEAALAGARARVEEAQALLEKTLLRAPADGAVLRRYRKPGELVSSNGNTPVYLLGDTRRLRVRMDVDETDVARLAVGQSAYVTAAAYGARRFPGKVVRIGQALGRKNVRTDEPTERVDTKILETLIELEPGAALPIGLRVDAYIELGVK
jgi:HlyD family secretion protein